MFVDVLVQPRASRAKVGPAIGDRLKVAVTAPPVDGKANGAVIELLARDTRSPARANRNRERSQLAAQDDPDPRPEPRSRDRASPGGIMKFERGTTYALALAMLAVGCTGNEGTVTIRLATAPGSTLLDTVQRVRLSLSDPPAQIERERGSDGRFFARPRRRGRGPGRLGDLRGLRRERRSRRPLAGAGTLPIAAVSGELAVYVAAPLSIAEAPVALDPVRTAMGSGALSFGVVLVGWPQPGQQRVGRGRYLQSLRPRLAGRGAQCSSIGSKISPSLAPNPAS